MDTSQASGLTDLHAAGAAFCCHEVWTNVRYPAEKRPANNHGEVVGSCLHPESAGHAAAARVKIDQVDPRDFSQKLQTGASYFLGLQVAGQMVGDAEWRLRRRPELRNRLRMVETIAYEELPEVMGCVGHK